MPVQDFLNQRAVNIVVRGSYTLPNWYDAQGKLRTFACRTTRVSPFRMIVEVPVVGKIGDRLTSYFREFGKRAASATRWAAVSCSSWRWRAPGAQSFRTC
jgi:hypothetical protein